MKVQLIATIICISLVGCSTIRTKWLLNDYNFSKSKEKYQMIKKEKYENGNTKRIERTKTWKLKNYTNAGIYSERYIMTYYESGQIKSDTMIMEISNIWWDLSYPRTIKYKQYYSNGRLKEKGEIKQSYTGQKVKEQSGTVKYYSENGELEKVKEVK